MLLRTAVWPCVWALGLAQLRIASGNRIGSANSWQSTVANATAEIHITGLVASKRDDAIHCDDGYYLCGDAAPECVAVGTPCSDGRPREGPTLCSQVPVNSPVYDDDGNVVKIIPVIGAICACIQDGMFTTATYANLVNTLQTDPTALEHEYQICEGFEPKETCVEVLTPSFVSATYAEAASRTSTCKYPPSNFTPNQCGTGCSFECNAGYQQCGDTCEPAGSPCPSGSLRRRHLSPPSCPSGYNACPVGSDHHTRSKLQGYECLHTRTDIESCGGCMFPLPGAELGEDCTSIAGVKDVECLEGRCVAKSCLEGFLLSGEKCISSPDDRRSFWSRLL